VLDEDANHGIRQENRDVLVFARSRLHTLSNADFTATMLMIFVSTAEAESALAATLTAKPSSPPARESLAPAIRSVAISIAKGGRGGH